MSNDYLKDLQKRGKEKERRGWVRRDKQRRLMLGKERRGRLCCERWHSNGKEWKI